MLSDFIEPQGGRRRSLSVQFLSFNVNAKVMKPIEEKKNLTKAKLNENWTKVYTSVKK